MAKPTKTVVKGWVVQYANPKLRGATVWLSDVGDAGASVGVIGRIGVFKTRDRARGFIRADRLQCPDSPLAYRIRRATVTLEIA